MRPFLAKSTLFFFVTCSLIQAQNKQESDLRAKAERLAHEFIIVDTHIDVPYRLRMNWEDISQRTPKGNFDFVRATEGGLNAPFMSIYIPSEYEAKGGGKALADTLINMVEGFASRWPKLCAVATSVSDVTRLFKRGRISLCLGMENGTPIEHDLSNVRYFYDRGIRYITLAHGEHNHISDSSYDSTRVWKGLSPFGRQVVREMNRVGVMVDVSHIYDDAFREVINISKAPVIASHSSCRAFTPGFERNMSDDMIRLLAKNQGVIMINFGNSFLNSDYQLIEGQIWSYLSSHKLRFNDPEAQAYIRQFLKDNPLPKVTVADVAAHIDHVVKLVGVDYVGLGSDFDGVGDMLPEGLRDVSHYPNIIFELLKKGFSDKDIEKICGLNLLRVWGDVEKIARRLQTAEQSSR